MHTFHRHHTKKFFLVGLCLPLLLLLAACSGYAINPLGYGFAYDQMASPTPGHVVFPTVTPVKNPDPLLKQAGMGNTLDTFFAKYQPLPISHPPTHFAFQQTLDAWPGGSILFVEFENGALDLIPRAVQFSLVPGTNHPTTYEQAEAFVQSFLPDDRTGPVRAQALDTNNYKCLVMIWNSPDLAKIFPPEDFLGGTNGKLGKPGDIVVSFFPHVVYDSASADRTLFQTGMNNDSIDNADIIGSVLVALGDRPSC